MRIFWIFAFVFVVSLADPTFAKDTDYVLTIKDHAFSPAELTVPAHQKVTLRIINQDATAEEFESSDLKREKVVGPNKSITVKVGPLEPGSYAYFGDFHRDTATGTIIAK